MAYARVEKAILSIFEELAGDLVCEEAYSALKEEYNARMDPDIDEDFILEVIDDTIKEFVTKPQEPQEIAATPPPADDIRVLLEGAARHREFTRATEEDDPSTSVMTEEELGQYVKSRKNPNTLKKTDQIIRKFEKWLTDHREERPLEQIEPLRLNNLVGNYLYNLEKDDGTDYEPDTLTSYHRGIERYLKEKNYPCNILTDKEFESSRSVLAARRNELKAKGLGNRPNKSEALTPAQIETMWERGVLGSETPRTLQNSVFFLFSKGFGFRGCHESKQLEWGDVSLHVDETGTEYVQFSERESKTRHGEAGSAPRAFPPKIFSTGDERCPVRLFKEFSDHRPEPMNIPGAPFYLTVKAAVSPSDRVWYACCPMGKNTLQKILSGMTKACGFVGRFTNHSVRKTCCQELLNNDVAPTTICQLTGHKNVQSLNNYTEANVETQRRMSDILMGAKTTKRKEETAVTEAKRPKPAAVDQMLDCTRSLLSGATVHGNITINLHYNVHSNSVSSTSEVHVSPQPSQTIDN